MKLDRLTQVVWTTDSFQRLVSEVRQRKAGATLRRVNTLVGGRTAGATLRRVNTIYEDTIYEALPAAPFEDVCWHGFVWEARVAHFVEKLPRAQEEVAEVAVRETLAALPSYETMAKVCDDVLTFQDEATAPGSWDAIAQRGPTPLEVAVEQLLEPCLVVWRAHAPRFGLREVCYPHAMPQWLPQLR